MRKNKAFKRGDKEAVTKHQDPNDTTTTYNEQDIDKWSDKQLSGFVRMFFKSNNEELVFPPTLLPKQRSFIHGLCSVFGLEHKSHGPKTARVLTISRPKNNGEENSASRGYRGAQLLPECSCLKNSHDFAEINTVLQPLYQNAIDEIKIECAKKQRGTHRNFNTHYFGCAPTRKPSYDETYKKLQEFRKGLPAYKEGKRVLNALRNNDIAIVCGETGSGKTTQIPRMIYDSGLIHRDKIIICTQPRRISALSVAQRVAEELGEECGNTCGYTIRFENQTSSKTRIVYMTTGILLRRLQTDSDLKDVGCVIVDEVHERDVETDFCLLFLRDRLLAKKSGPSLKVVVMSATIQIEKLRNYFSKAVNKELSIINIPGVLHPVKEYFLEDALKHIGEPVPTNNLQKSRENKVPKTVSGNETYAELYNILSKTSTEDLCPIEVITQLILYCHKSRRNTSGSILVFLPGWSHISKVASRLKAHPASKTLWILLLHSSLTSAEQKRVFQPPPGHYRKVVLSTNIAETSITIDDVVWVIDSCLSKGTSYESSGDFTSLKSQVIAKANGIQRRGRAGRCQDGICYHLLPHDTYDQLPDFLPPQIMCTSLEEVCLQVKAITGENCATVLSRALDPPSLQSIKHSVNLLTSMGVLVENDETLTPLGIALAQLPIHPLLGKMLFAATCFGVLETVAVIASSLSIKSPFIVPRPEERRLAHRALRVLDDGMLSDHFSVLHLYQNWVRSGRRRDYAFENFADPNSLYLLERTKRQLIALVLKSPLAKHIPQPKEKFSSRYSDNKALVRLVLLWSLYPRIATVEFRKTRPKLASVICWDLSPAEFANSSALMKRYRQDFGERTFVFYFERMFLEQSLNLLDATSVSPIEISLCVRDLILCPLEDVPSIVLEDPGCKFLPAYPFYKSTDEMGPGEGRNPENINLYALFFDGGKKLYVTKREFAMVLQQVRICIEYYLAKAVGKLRADAFPDDLIKIISRIVGEPCTERISFEETPLVHSLEPLVGDQFHLDENGDLVRNVVDGDDYLETELLSNEDGFEVEYDVGWEDNTENTAYVTPKPQPLFTAEEVKVGRNFFGDLSVFSTKEISKMLEDLASRKARDLKDFNALEEELQSNATKAQEEKREINLQKSQVGRMEI